MSIIFQKYAPHRQFVMPCSCVNISHLRMQSHDLLHACTHTHAHTDTLTELIYYPSVKFETNWQPGVMCALN